MRLSPGLVLLALTAACSNELNRLDLILPEEAKTLVLLVHDSAGFRGQTYDVRGHTAQLFNTAIDSGIDSTVYALIYDLGLGALDLSPGEFREPSPDEYSRPIPTPASVLAAEVVNGRSEGFAAVDLPEVVAGLRVPGPSCFPELEPPEEKTVARSSKLHEAGLTGYGITLITDRREILLVSVYVESLGRVPEDLALGPMQLAGGDAWFALVETAERLTVGVVGREGMIVRSSTVNPEWSEPALLQLYAPNTSTEAGVRICRIDQSARLHVVGVEGGELVERGSVAVPESFVAGALGITNGKPWVAYSTSVPELLVFDRLEEAPDIVPLPEGVSGVLAGELDGGTFYLITNEHQLIRIAGDPRQTAMTLLGDTGLGQQVPLLGRSGERVWFIGSEGRAGFLSLTAEGKLCPAQDVGLGTPVRAFRSLSPAALIGIDSSGPDIVLRRLALPPD